MFTEKLTERVADAISRSVLFYLCQFISLSLCCIGAFLTLKYAYHDKAILSLVFNLLPEQSDGNLDSEAFKKAIKNSSLLSRPLYYLMNSMLVSMNQYKYCIYSANKIS